MPTQPEQTKPGILSIVLFREILLIGLLVVIIWKLINAHFNFNLATFSFTDFLNLFLALFSVGLSVAFYFKATEASNQFYDNTYKFTKDMSEILGRIEAGFGERLRHLDEGYSGMRERLDKLPQYTGATSLEVKREEEEIKKKELEQKALIEDLARKAKLAEHEKRALFENLAKKSEELEQARMELRQMQNSRRRGSSESPAHRVVIQYVAKRMKNYLPSDLREGPITTALIQKTFNEIKHKLHEEAIRDMEKFDLLNSNGELTHDGLMFLRIELKQI